jgi:hypothetical protein
MYVLYYRRKGGAIEELVIVLKPRVCTRNATDVLVGFNALKRVVIIPDTIDSSVMADKAHVFNLASHCKPNNQI